MSFDCTNKVSRSILVKAYFVLINIPAAKSWKTWYLRYLRGKAQKVQNANRDATIIREKRVPNWETVLSFLKC